MKTFSQFCEDIGDPEFGDRIDPEDTIDPELRKVMIRKQAFVALDGAVRNAFRNQSDFVLPTYQKVAKPILDYIERNVEKLSRMEAMRKYNASRTKLSV